MEIRITTTVLSTRAEKAAVSRGGYRLYTLVQMTPPPQEPVARMRRPVAIALVIDRSGSMAGGKLEAACSAAQQLVPQLTPADRVAVIGFDQGTHNVVPLMMPDAVVIERIAELRSGGQTALFEGWQAGVDILQKDPGPRAAPEAGAAAHRWPGQCVALPTRARRSLGEGNATNALNA